MPEITLATQIGLVWEDAAENGGTEVLDYTVSFDQGIGVWTTFASSIIPQEYTAIGLSQGVVYSFKVLARNKYGESFWSDPVSILAAQIPD